MPRVIRRRRPGPQPDADETFHDDLPGEGAGERGVLPRGEQRHGEERAGQADAEHGAEEVKGVLDLRHVLMARPVERGRREDEDGGIDEEREHERDARIDGGEFDGLAFALGGLRELAGLHDGGVQVEIVRHDRGADDADADVEHGRVGDDMSSGDETEQDAAEAGLGKNQLGGEARADGGDERDDQRLDVAKAFALQIEDGEDIERGDDAAPDERDVEEKLQGDGRADDLREIAGGDGHLAQDPEEPDGGPRIMIAAGLREVATGDDAELDAQVLQQDRHEIRDHDDREERVAELRAASEVGGPVAGIHVTDGHEETGPGKGEQLPPERGIGRHEDAAVHLGQRNLAGLPAPGGLRVRGESLVRITHGF